MAKQKFTAVEREAIWAAHEKKCAYTGELIDVNNFHIDHVIPEKYKFSPDKFSSIKKEFGLPCDFDIYDYGNVLPCKPSINLQKKDKLLNVTSIHFYLNLAKSKEIKIYENIEIIKLRRDKGKVFMLLQQLVESGKLTTNEVINFMEKHSDNPQEIFELLVHLEFADESKVQNLLKEDIQQLKSKPIKFGKNQHINGVTFQKNGHEIVLNTCIDYENAIKNGYSPSCNFDLKMSSYLSHQCALLSAFETARIPDKSFISNPFVSIKDLHLIPATLWQDFGDEIVELSPSESYFDMVNRGILFVRSATNHSLLVESEGMGQRLIEVARADFNNDGIEEIFLFQYSYATRGTFGYGDTIMLTRKSSDKMFEVVT